MVLSPVWQIGNYFDIRFLRCNFEGKCDASILRDKFGTTEACGWEIDHLKPVYPIVTEEPRNLLPFHWQNNRHEGDNCVD